MASPDLGNLRLSSDSEHEEGGFGGYDAAPKSPPPAPQQSQAQGEVCCARAEWLHSGDEPEIFASGRA